MERPKDTFYLLEITPVALFLPFTEPSAGYIGSGGGPVPGGVGAHQGVHCVGQAEEEEEGDPPAWPGGAQEARTAELEDNGRAG